MGEDAQGVVRYRIVSDLSFYETAAARSLIARPTRRYASFLIRAVGSFAIYLGVSGFFDRGQQWIAILVALLIAFPLLSGWIDRVYRNRRLRKSPHLNESVSLTLEEEGLSFTGKFSNGCVGWAGCTRADRFSDGILLFHGPGFYRWLPDASIEEGSSAEEAVELVRSQVLEYVDRSV